MYRRHKADTRAYALFDVSAASVGVALGTVGPTGTRTIDWWKRVSFSTLEERAYEEYVKHCYAALMEAATTLTTEGVRSVPTGTYSAKNLNILCRLSPPWMFATPVCVEKKLDKRANITHTILDNVRATAYEQVLALQEFSRWQEVAGHGVPVEQRDQLLTLDGYEVQQHRTYDAQHIELIHYVALSSPDIMARIEEILRTAFPHHAVQFSTSTICFAQNLAHEPSTIDPRKLIVEVGGHTTTVSMVRDGVVHGTSGFPEGLHDMMKAAAPKAASREEVEGVLQQLVEQHKNEWDTLPDTLAAELSEWSKGLQEAVVRATHGTTPPLDTYLIVDQRYYELYAHAAAQPWKHHGIRSLRSLTPHPYSVDMSRVTPNDKAPDMRLLALLDPVDDATLHT